MNPIDKKIFRALQFLSEGNKSYIETIRKNNWGIYYDRFPEEVQNDLINLGYIDLNVDLSKPLLTNKGLEKLRILENTSRKDWSLGISIVVLVISAPLLYFTFKI